MAKRSYELLYRDTKRCAEACSDPEIHPEVKSMYLDVLVTPATVYGAAYEAVPVAETLASEAHTALSGTMVTLDKEFRRVRAIVKGRFPSTVVPATLKEQATPTEQKAALAALLGLVTARRGEPWADAILAGSFGTMSPDALTKLDAVISADTRVASAKQARADAAGPAYAAYLQFTQVLRQEPGPMGRFYKRLRAHRTAAVVTPAPTPEPPVVSPSPVATLSPTNGAAH